MLVPPLTLRVSRICLFLIRNVLNIQPLRVCHIVLNIQPIPVCHISNEREHIPDQINNLLFMSRDYTL